MAPTQPKNTALRSGKILPPPAIKQSARPDQPENTPTDNKETSTEDAQTDLPGNVDRKNSKTNQVLAEGEKEMGRPATVAV